MAPKGIVGVTDSSIQFIGGCFDPRSIKCCQVGYLPPVQSSIFFASLDFSS